MYNVAEWAYCESGCSRDDVCEAWAGEMVGADVHEFVGLRSWVNVSVDAGC